MRMDFIIILSSKLTNIQEKLMHGNGPAAASATLLLNTHLSLKVEPGCKIKTIQKSFQSFPQFQKLPSELRNQIAREAMPSRVVEIDLFEYPLPDADNYLAQFDSSFSNLVLVGTSSPTPPPITLSVNREFRNETLRRYKPMFGNYQTSEPRYKKPIYLDPTRDTPYFSKFTPLPKSHRWGDLCAALDDYLCQLGMHKASYIKSIRNFALPFPSRVDNYRVTSAFFKCSGLKEVTFIANDGHQCRRTATAKGQISNKSLGFSDVEDAHVSRWEELASNFFMGSLSDFQRIKEVYADTMKEFGFFGMELEHLNEFPAISVKRIV